MRADWNAPDGLLLPYEHWKARGPVRAVLLCVHGMGGASCNFEPLGEALPEEGIEVYAINLRGQGNDPRGVKRGAELNLKLIIADLEAFSFLLRTRHPEVPLFVLGESMGALILQYALASNGNSANWSGVVFSVPVVALIKPTSWPVRFIVKALAKLVPMARFYPAWFVSGKTESLTLTRDRAYQDGIKTKPHYIHAFTFRFLEALGNLIASSDGSAKKISIPCLVLVAGQDCFIRPEQIEAWFPNLTSADKTMLKYPEAYHLLWHDSQTDEVVADIKKWLTAQTARLSPVAG